MLASAGLGGVVVLLHVVVAVLDAALAGEALRFFAGLAEAVVPALGVVFILLFLLEICS